MNASELPAPPAIIGVDPGPIPGVVLIRPGPPLVLSAFQCDSASVLWLIRALLHRSPYASRTILAVERYVVGTRAGRLATPQASALTRNIVGAVVAIGTDQEGLRGEQSVSVVQRSASEVMTWASDKRLSTVGLYRITAQMQHARAAARHALFAAVRDGGMRDPLSKDWPS
jgi:hypothetical protein